MGAADGAGRTGFAGGAAPAALDPVVHLGPAGGGQRPDAARRTGRRAARPGPPAVGATGAHPRRDGAARRGRPTGAGGQAQAGERTRPS
ncbi:hypothetical protein SCOCK_820001 [Actinacidiphila cocklensis]|uniref:Uncharacterized protein n=1 Tax=Actinacidiphila cocklensis TaxID=887465 RepID=A0A9W4DX05_9ACTN|nr:hypothetical protein SCOCK_820001 [Actinacidiphila cocklensis]